MSKIKNYPQGVKEKIIKEYNNGLSQRELSRKYGISRYAIQCWIGARSEVSALPKQRGRKPARTLQEYKYENKRLKMENELLRDFLLFTKRKCTWHNITSYIVFQFNMFYYTITTSLISI